MFDNVRALPPPTPLAVRDPADVDVDVDVDVDGAVVDIVVGSVLRVRRMSGRAFVHVWLPEGLVQVVYEGELAEDVRPGGAIAVTGRCVRAALKDPSLGWRDREVVAQRIEVLSSPRLPPPFDVGKPELAVTPETRFDARSSSLRHPKVRAVFGIQDALVHGFQTHLRARGFTEIHSPKLGAEGAEGGANVFELPYFGRKAVLAQSPQFYKELCVAAFGRVFEVGPVFRAEPHATSRHLNEYTSLDVELGPIRSVREVMGVEVGALAAMFAAVRERCGWALALLGISVPELDEDGVIPAIPFAEVKRRTGDTDHDLSPAEEQQVSAWALAETGSELVFVTRYPSSKRPFYAMDSPDDPTVTESFDLLFRGVEITTGGQRIHDPDALEAKIRARGLDPAAFAHFLAGHRHGLPPHGGFGLGLERLTARLCGLDNVRDAALFPRDAHRLVP